MNKKNIIITLVSFLILVILLGWSVFSGQKTNTATVKTSEPVNTPVAQEPLTQQNKSGIQCVSASPESFSVFIDLEKKRIHLVSSRTTRDGLQDNSHTLIQDGASYDWSDSTQPGQAVKTVFKPEDGDYAVIFDEYVKEFRGSGATCEDWVVDEKISRYHLG